MRKQLLIVGVSALLIGGGSGFVGGFVATHENSPVAINANSAPEIISPSPVFSPSPIATATPPKTLPKPTVVPTIVPVIKPTPKPIIKPSPKPSPKPIAPHKVTWSDPTPALTQGEIDGPTAIGTGVPVTVTGTWTCTNPPDFGFLIGIRDLNTMNQVWLRAQDVAMLELYYNMSSIPGHSYLLMVQFFGDSTVLCDWNLTMTV